MLVVEARGSVDAIQYMVDRRGGPLAVFQAPETLR
jgi:hypothetical protein